MPDRVAVFIDYMNCYKGARDAFFGLHPPSYVCGQIYPRLLGLKLKNNAAGDRELVGVWVYRGMPSSRFDRKGHAAADRQIGLWKTQSLVHPYHRTLNYRDPSDPKEKGIDVKLAVDMVMMAKEDYDIAVLVSEDTDLLPALEAVADMKGTSAIEVATWVPNTGASATPLRVKGHGHLIHRLTFADYNTVHDPTDYTERRRRR